MLIREASGSSHTKRNFGEGNVRGATELTEARGATLVLETVGGVLMSYIYKAWWWLRYLGSSGGDLFI